MTHPLDSNVLMDPDPDPALSIDVFGYLMGEGFVFQLTPPEEATADLVAGVGRMLREKASEPSAPMYAAADLRLSGYANLKLSDMAELATMLGCRVKVSLEPREVWPGIEDDVRKIEKLMG